LLPVLVLILVELAQPKPNPIKSIKTQIPNPNPTPWVFLVQISVKDHTFYPLKIKVLHDYSISCYLIIRNKTYSPLTEISDEKSSMCVIEPLMAVMHI
jgi:hypothetical protein